MNHVLGILEDDESLLERTFDCAIGLAVREHARLTLAKTTDPGWLMRWFAPAAIQSMMVPETFLEFEQIAGHRLAAASEFVPAEVPVTTLVLPRNTGKGIRRLLQSGRYDVLVATEALLHHCARLAREVAEQEIEIVCVPTHPVLPANLDMIGARR